MISSQVINPVGDVRLATGVVSRKTRSIVTFSTVQMVTVVVENDGLVISSNHRQGRRVESKLDRRMGEKKSFK